MAVDRAQLMGKMRTNLAGLRHGSLGIPVLLLVMLGMMMLPIPPFLLDVFFTFNIALSLVVLLVCAYALRPLDFAVFPTILLISTLLRLALNVASTRVVLLYGHECGDGRDELLDCHAPASRSNVRARVDEVAPCTRRVADGHIAQILP